MSIQITDLKHIYLLLAQLPQCETGRENILNLHNGLMAEIKYTEEGKLFGPKTRKASAILVTYTPAFVSGTTQYHWMALDADGALKLLRVWVAQAKSLGLPVSEAAEAAAAIP